MQTKRQTLTNRQQDVYEKLTEIWIEQGRQPTITKVADELGVHSVTIIQHLKVISRKGGLLQYKSEGPGKAPIIKILDENVKKQLVENLLGNI